MHHLHDAGWNHKPSSSLFWFHQSHLDFWYILQLKWSCNKTIILYMVPARTMINFRERLQERVYLDFYFFYNQCLYLQYITVYTVCLLLETSFVRTSPFSYNQITNSPLFKNSSCDICNRHTSTASSFINIGIYWCS